MKATIRADGFLVLQPDTDLEAYALKHWSAENLGSDWFNCTGVPRAPITVDMGNFALATGAVLRVTP